MEAWLSEISHYVGLTIEAMAIVVIAYASVATFIAVIRLAFRTASDAEKRVIWIRYLRWLVAGLTFQLAADIVHTAVTPTWEDLGRVAAIAVIRTFLGYFLERDMREASDKLTATT